VAGVAQPVEQRIR